MKKYLVGFFIVFAFMPNSLAQTFTLVKDIRAGVSTSAPDELTAFNNKLYFRANNGINGNELFVTDGTEPNTLMVKDIRPGASGGSVALMSVLNNNLSFFSNDGTNGVELFKSDGTEPGTTLVMDVNPGTASSVGGFYTTLNGYKYWDGTVNDASGPVTELWRTDGTAAGTTLVKAIQTAGTGGSSPRSFATIGNQIFFFADDGVSGYEVWRSDGTAAGTTLTKDINPGSLPSSPEGLEIRGFNNIAYFKKSNGVNGVELWRSDGTEFGTYMVKDINPGAGSSNPFNFIVYNNLLYFIATDGTSNKLWKTDGTAAVTISLAEAGGTFSSSGLNSMAISNNYLFFPGVDATNGMELWKTDGTIGGTTIVKDINLGTASSNLANFINVGNKIVFQATTASEGAEPWSSDGTATGTNLMHDIEPGNGSSLIERFTIVGSKLFALATTTLYGREVWVINNFVVVPLKFISFSAQKCSNNQVCLHWKTANEQNVSHFEIERSTDGILFSKIATKPANNFTNNTYTATDDINTIQTKQLYYRIKQVDVNGKTTTSTIQLIKLQHNEQITIYPNPVADEINITNWSKVQQVQLVDVMGKIVKQWQAITSSSLKVNEITAGVYFVKMQLVSGELQMQKIVKQ
jgi:trimeric autotransporter adhesin